MGLKSPPSKNQTLMPVFGECELEVPKQRIKKGDTRDARQVPPFLLRMLEVFVLAATVRRHELARRRQGKEEFV